MMGMKSHRFHEFWGYFLSKTYRNEHRVDKNEHTGFDIEAI